MIGLYLFWRETHRLFKINIDNTDCRSLYSCENSRIQLNEFQRKKRW